MRKPSAPSCVRRFAGAGCGAARCRPEGLLESPNALTRSLAIIKLEGKSLFFFLLFASG
jgi:hypothetical protein